MDIFISILFLIYLLISWRSLNYLQNMMGLTFFMNLNGFMQMVVLKFIAACLLGWLFIPIVFIQKLLARQRPSALDIPLPPCYHKSRRSALRRLFLRKIHPRKDDSL